MSYRYLSVRNECISRIILTLLPLMTTAHVSRVLGPDGMGVSAAALNAVSYFIIAAECGNDTLGIRTVSQNRDNAQEEYCDLISLQIITSLFSIILYICALIISKASLILWIQLIRLVSCMMDHSWLLKGLEHSDRYALTFTGIRIIDAVCILGLVREDCHPVEVYGLIQAAGTLAASAASVLYARCYGFIFRFRTDKTGTNLKESVKLFLPAAALRIYQIIDQGMLGWLSVPVQSGYYACADRIINIPFGIISGVLVLLMPKAVRLHDRKEDHLQYCSDCMTFLIISAVMISCGLIMVSHDFILLLYGQEYEPVIWLIRTMSPFIILKTYTTQCRNLYLIPQRMQKEDTVMICTASLINVLLDMILIPGYGASGAAAGTVLSEAVLAVMNRKIRKQHSAVSGKAVFRSFLSVILCLILHSVISHLSCSPVIRMSADILVWTMSAGWIFCTKQMKAIRKRIMEENGTER